MVVLTWLAGLDDDVQLCSCLVTDQVVVYCTNRQKYGDVRMVRIHTAVGKHDQGVTICRGQVRLGTYPVQRVSKALNAVGDREER